MEGRLVLWFTIGAQRISVAIVSNDNQSSSCIGAQFAEVDFGSLILGSPEFASERNCVGIFPRYGLDTGVDDEFGTSITVFVTVDFLAVRVFGLRRTTRITNCISRVV